MAVLFLLLAFLVAVVVAAAGLENTTASTATLFDRSFGLTDGQLLVVFAGLGFLVAVFLFLAFGASRTRRAKRKELKSRRRDAEGRVDELERENSRLRQELESVERGRTDAVAERDRAEATADSIRSNAAASPDRVAATPPEPDSTRRERLDDRTATSPVGDEHAHAADEHARAADEHARAADEEARRR